MKIKKYEATWCGACKTVDALLKEFTGVEKIDIDNLKKEEVKALGIKKLPTIIVENTSGEEVFRHVGATLDVEELKTWLKEN